MKYNIRYYYLDFFQRFMIYLHGSHVLEPCCDIYVDEATGSDKVAVRVRAANVTFRDNFFKRFFRFVYKVFIFFLYFYVLEYYVFMSSYLILIFYCLYSYNLSYLYFLVFLLSIMKFLIYFPIIGSDLRAAREAFVMPFTQKVFHDRLGLLKLRMGGLYYIYFSTLRICLISFLPSSNYDTYSGLLLLRLYALYLFYHGFTYSRLVSVFSSDMSYLVLCFQRDVSFIFDFLHNFFPVDLELLNKDVLRIYHGEALDLLKREGLPILYVHCVFD